VQLALLPELAGAVQEGLQKIKCLSPSPRSKR
jgi:hypothetical protein